MLNLVEPDESMPAAQVKLNTSIEDRRSYLNNVARSGSRSGKCLADILVRNRGLLWDCAWVIRPCGVAPGHPSKCDESGRREQRGHSDLIVCRRRRPHPFRIEGAWLCRVGVARHVDDTLDCFWSLGDSSCGSLLVGRISGGYHFFLNDLRQAYEPELITQPLLHSAPRHPGSSNGAGRPSNLTLQ